MTRFFVEPEEMQPEFLVLTGENAKHAKVLRLKCGEEVLVCDGQGSECVCTVTAFSAGEVQLTVTERRASASEAAVKVSIYMGFLLFLLLLFLVNPHILFRYHLILCLFHLFHRYS